MCVKIHWNFRTTLPHFVNFTVNSLHRGIEIADRVTVICELWLIWIRRLSTSGALLSIIALFKFAGNVTVDCCRHCRRSLSKYCHVDVCFIIAFQTHSARTFSVQFFLISCHRHEFQYASAFLFLHFNDPMKRRRCQQMCLCMRQSYWITQNIPTEAMVKHVWLNVICSAVRRCHSKALFAFSFRTLSRMYPVHVCVRLRTLTWQGVSISIVRLKFNRQFDERNEEKY